jgi:hypothetical protein
MYTFNMNTFRPLPTEANHALLQDSLQRDPVTARRVALLNLLWAERYLSREQLIARLELSLGRGCFGCKAWKDTFYRDMRFVKRAFARAGFTLKYSRTPDSRGYYLSGEPALHPSLTKSISGALGELDPRQIEIYRQISPAQKFFQAASIIDVGRRIAAQGGQA